MLKKQFSPLFALGLLLASILHLPAAEAVPRFAPETSDMPGDPAVRWGRLDNGLRYAIRRNAIPQGRASLRFVVAAGSLQETDSQRGLAHFLEHMAFNGSTHFPAGTLVEFFQRMGMSFGGDTNAYTSFDRTVYMLELPDVQPATLEQSFTLFADYAQGLLLAPAEIEKERGVILSEKRARDSAPMRDWEATQQFLLPQARIPWRNPIGTTEVISHAPVEEFLKYYHDWYRPEKITVVAVGDFDVAAVEALLQKHLGGVQARGPQPADPDLGRVVPPAGLVAHVHAEPELAGTTVSIATVAPYVFEPDSQRVRADELVRGVAMMMLNRRLEILAKKPDAPFLQVGGAIWDSNDFVRTAMLQLGCKPEQWPAALSAGEQELRKALEFGFDPAELKETVALLRNALEQGAKTAANRSSPDLADGVVESVLTRKVFNSPEGNATVLLPVLDRLTVDDCVRALRAGWAGVGRFLLVNGNVLIPEGEKAVVQAYTASTRVTVGAPGRTAEGVFAYTDFGPAGKVRSARSLDDLGLRQVEFENGVRLNLKKTDFEVGTIGLMVRVGGGVLSQPRNQPGLTYVASGVLPQIGLGRHDVDELQRLLAGRNAFVTFGIDETAFVLAGGTTPSDLQLALQLACAYLVDPGYRPEALSQFQRGLDPFYESLAHTVEGPLRKQAMRALVSDDPRFGVPEKAELLGYTMENLKAWLAPELAGGPIEISLVGDLDPERTIALVAQTFGALPVRRPKPDYAEARRVRLTPEPVQMQFTVPTMIDRALVELDWPAGDGVDFSRNRRVLLLAEIFKDRLREMLREKMGDTYNPSAAGSLSTSYPGLGWLKVSVAVAPERVDAVVAAIKQLAAELAAGGVTPDELERARRPVLTSIAQNLRMNSYWLGQVLAESQETPRKLEAARTLQADWAAITPPELDRLAAELLAPARVSVFISKPAPKAP